MVYAFNAAWLATAGPYDEGWGASVGPLAGYYRPHGIRRHVAVR